MSIQHPFNNKWILWYHNPYDCNWSNDSYNKLYEIDGVDNYWRLYYSMQQYLPDINEAMYFIMKRKGEDIIWPNWEDKYNIKGGFWSFKVSSDHTNETWKNLSLYLMTEQLCNNKQDNDKINGISISPKKCFSIIKIWTSENMDDVSVLNNNIPFINLKESIYKTHDVNIENDQKKR